MNDTDRYASYTIKEVEKRKETLEFEKELKQQGISDILGTINLYSQLYILDSDLKSLGINYEKL